MGQTQQTGHLSKADFCTGGFSEEARSRDPQPCNVTEFPSLLARRIAYAEPHYVLFTADIDEETGVPWCPDCARMIDSARKRVADTGGTLMEVQVRPLQAMATFSCIWPLIVIHSLSSSFFMGTKASET